MRPVRPYLRIATAVSVVLMALSPVARADEAADTKAQIDALLQQLRDLPEAKEAVRAILTVKLAEHQTTTDGVSPENISDEMKAVQEALKLLDTLDAPAAATVETAAAPQETAPPVQQAGATSNESIKFNRDIRHILSSACFACHGPDQKTRKAGLRLDLEADAFKPGQTGQPVIVRGDRANSELYRRITTQDAADHMPPLDEVRQLTPQEIELLGQWIDEGATWEAHWSLIPPSRPEPPAVQDASWPKNAIDHFIAARLTEAGLSPSPEADARTLIRRVTFDLTGLPPTVEEVEAFVADTAPDAYERLVDRLLASPRYGEHMSRFWLDIARYADTNGYHIDNERHMWRWREWVIDAFNTNMPWDQFTVEQLAGDLLPNPTLEQRIASGFNRNHMINFEGGAIPEEYRVQYVLDRVDATSTAWMGMTMHCAQCHDHKYDPISQREFYEMFAFFNNVAEQGLDGREGNAPPLIPAPTEDQTTRIAALDKDIDALRSFLHREVPELDAQQAVWERDEQAAIREQWAVLGTLSTGLTPVPIDEKAEKKKKDEDKTPASQILELAAFTDAQSITGLRFEVAPSPAATPEQSAQPLLIEEVELFAAPAMKPDALAKVPLSAVTGDGLQKEPDYARAIDGKPDVGWALDPGDRSRAVVFMAAQPLSFERGAQLRIRVRHRTPEGLPIADRLRVAVTTAADSQASTLGPWYVSGPYTSSDGKTAHDTAYTPEEGVDLKATYPDGRQKWELATPEFIDGEVQDLTGEVAATYLYRTLESPGERNVTISLGSNDGIKAWVNGKLLLDKDVERGAAADQDLQTFPVKAGTNEILLKIVNYGGPYRFYFAKVGEKNEGMPLDVQVALDTDPDRRGADQKSRLLEYFRREHSPEWKVDDDELAALVEEKTTVESEIPTSMVMAEMETPRETFVLARGQYDQPTDKVTPAVPAALPKMDPALPANRLGLAKWLVDPDHPLTSRVTVNRFWQRLFGAGIVKTSEDFGVQGDWPSHPELLDWLATEFVSTGWDVKHMMKLMVTSATYKQQSRLIKENVDKDPENRLLARGPRYRLDAEVVRDNALALGGLLVEKVGGPSVRPYQPKGIWEEVAYGSGFTAQRFVQDKGESLYRRSMYTFWKRQAPPPSMMVFDAPNREVCTARRPRTNTPLQALALMNDPQFFEAARGFAQRVLLSSAQTPEERLAFAFQMATARPPSQNEMEVFMTFYNELTEEYRSNTEGAERLVLVGESQHDPALDRTELAIWSAIANLILNLDETITKG